jgi:prevent-host-death family protein
MNETPITVSEASRNLAAYVNRTHYQKQIFVVLKNGVPMARLVPAGKPVCRGSDLAEALAAVSLTDAQARAWQRDLVTARKKREAPNEREK